MVTDRKIISVNQIFITHLKFFKRKSKLWTHLKSYCTKLKLNYQILGEFAFSLLFVCSDIFCSFLFFVCMLFFLSLLFPHSARAFSNVAVRVSCKSARAPSVIIGHSSWLDSSSSSNQSKEEGGGGGRGVGGDVTPMSLIKLQDAQRLLVQVKMDYCQSGPIYFHTGHRICGHLSLLYVYLAIR